MGLEQRRGVNLPYPNYRWRESRFDDVTVYVLETWGEQLDDPDFEIDDQSRNLVAITDAGNVRWVVESVDGTTTGGIYHEDLYKLNDRLVSKANTGRFYEIDPETGVILDSWPQDEFKIADEVFEFDRPVGNVEVYDGVYIVKAGHHLFGIDESGGLRWKRDDGDTNWRLELDEGGVSLVTAEDRGRETFWYDYELDVHTGEVHNVNDDPEKFLGETVK